MLSLTVLERPYIEIGAFGHQILDDVFVSVIGRVVNGRPAVQRGVHVHLLRNLLVVGDTHSDWPSSRRALWLNPSLRSLDSKPNRMNSWFNYSFNWVIINRALLNQDVTSREALPYAEGQRRHTIYGLDITTKTIKNIKELNSKWIKNCSMKNSFDAIIETIRFNSDYILDSMIQK